MTAAPEHGLIMGILNVTPDSFSDGGRFEADTAADRTRLAVEHARSLIAQGADLIDVGGESTRPGAVPVPVDEERARVVDVVRELAREGVVVSVDTLHAETARACAEAGAKYINDVSGGLADPEVLRVVAETGARVILGHWRGYMTGADTISGTAAQYADPVADVLAELDARVAQAAAAGVPRERILIDPGLGFSKGSPENWALLRAVPRFAATGLPVVIGASRKRFTADFAPEGAPAAARDEASGVIAGMAVAAGAHMVRVHNVAATRTAVAVGRAWRGESADAAVSRGGDEDAARSHRDDRVTLTGLAVFAHHGVFDFERAEGQRFIIDADVTLRAGAVARAAAGDELAATLHYGELAEALRAAAERDPVDLIETLAERLAGVALSFAAAERVRLTVHKPDAPIDAEFADVSVSIERSRA